MTRSNDSFYTTPHKKQELLTRESECALSRRALAGDKQAAEVLVTHNQRLVVRIAQRKIQHGCHTPIEDLIQEGNIGLMTAVQKFDPDRGVRFATYATWWIRQQMDQTIPHNENIAIPLHVFRHANRVRHAQQALKTPDHAPSIKEIGDWTGFSAKRVTRMLDLPTSNTSLSFQGDRTDVDENITLNETIPAEGAADDQILDADQKTQLERIFLCLTEREQTILSMRYVEDQTLLTISEVMGMSKERVRQIECRCLKKIRETAADTVRELLST